MKNKKVIIFFLIQVFFSHSQNIVNDSIKLDEVVISITKIKESIKIITINEIENSLLLNSSSAEEKAELMDKHLKEILMKLSEKST